MRGPMSDEDADAISSSPSRALSRATNGKRQAPDGELVEENRRTTKQGQPPPATGTKYACARCRSLKARCEPQEDPRNGKCVRCTRLSFDCVWVGAQKRGRKSNRPSQVETRPQPADIPQSAKGNVDHGEREEGDPLDPLSMLASAAPMPFSSDDPASSSAQRQRDYSTTSLLPIGSTASAGPSPHSDAQRSYEHHTTGSLRDETSPRSTLPNLSMVDLAQAKERALQDLSAPGGVSIPHQRRIPPATMTESSIRAIEPDPIDMHVLSELDAQQLFDHYHTKMNAFIILLDPFLHRVDFVRKTSPVLFTTILAVSAKFIRPPLYRPLLMHAKQLTGRAIIDGKVSIGLIQSMLIQVYWKEPDDSSAWLRVGEAIRMGYQLHLHSHRADSLPEHDDFEARLILDRERTWIDLCAFDQTFFLQSGEEDDGFHQTCMIPHYRINVQRWLKETRRFGVDDDLEQGANFEWIKMQRLSRDILRARPGNARALGEHVQGTLEAAYQQYLDPSSPDAFIAETRPWIRVNFWLAAASLALARAMLTAVGIDGDLLANWVVSSGTFVDALEIIAKHGYIQYWQDTLGITLYSMGEFCVKIFPKVYPATQRAIVGWMERIYRACELCAEGKAESTAAFISRFFQLCLRAVCSPQNTANTTPERATNAGNNATHISSGVARMQNSVQQSLSNTHQLLDTMHEPLIGFHDASYWESIFPGLSTDWSWLDQSLEEGLAR